MGDVIDDMTPESGWMGQMSDDWTPESMKNNSFGDDYEGRAKEAKEADNVAKAKVEEENRKKRNTIFQSEGGSSGSGVLSVGARDTYFGN